MRLRPGTLAVVTGAGSGIGLAVARALAGRGCRLALIDVREDRLEAARAALAAVGPVVSAHLADVRVAGPRPRSGGRSAPRPCSSTVPGSRSPGRSRTPPPTPSAEKEARLAQEALEKIGAVGEAERAAGLLRRLAAPSRARRGSRDAFAGLTRREIDVLRLVAQGLHDREIATKLVLSEHTVHRHISNILAKLGLPSRAAAVAHAAHHGLL